MNDKKALRHLGRTTGLVLISHQLIFQLLSGLLMSFALLFLPSSSSSIYISSDIAMLVSGIIFLVFYFANRRVIKENSPHKGEITLAGFLKCIIIILAANAFLSAANILFTAATGLSLTVSAVEPDSASIPVLFFAVALFPAIVEELIFRGVIYRYLRQQGAPFAAFSSSLLFGLIHLNILQFLFAFCMGLVLCHIYERTGKLRYAMLLHFINNSLTVLACLFDPQTVMVAECVAGAAALVFGIIFIAAKKPRTDCRGLLSKCRYFFTSIPMLLLTAACLAVCVLVIFIA